MKFRFMVLLIALYPLVLWGQYDWITHTNSSSLSDGVRCINVISDEEVWIGTMSNGIQFFNGEGFSVFNTTTSLIPGDRVYEILFDPGGRKWIGTSAGLAIVENQSWEIYTSENSNMPGNQVISMIREPQGRIWIGTNMGVVNDLEGTVYTTGNSGLPGNQILDMFIDPDGAIWFGTENGIASYDGETWNTYPTGIGDLPNGAASAIARDLNGNIWASISRGIEGELFMLDTAGWKEIVTEPDLFDQAAITDIVIKENGDLWFGTHHNGIVTYDGQFWTRYLTENCDIPINQIICLLVDQNDNVWMGSRSGLTQVSYSPLLLNTRSGSGKDLETYPNPFTSYTTINLPTDHKIRKVELIDIQGKIVKTVDPVLSNSISLYREELENGIYFLRVYANEVYLRKVVIH